MSREPKIFVGDRFLVKGGWCEIVGYSNYRRVEIKFDKTGSIRTTRTDYLLCGRVIDYAQPSILGIGFIGDGPYSNKTNPHQYRLWCGVIKRCYSGKATAYKDCTVEESWHNFQNFCADVLQMVCEDGWELDKDLLSKERKVYSKATCVFLPQVLNAQFLTRERRELPEGVTLWHDGGKRYRAGINVKGKTNCLGFYDTPLEASRAYRAAKLERLLSLAEEFKYRIDGRAYRAFLKKAFDIYGAGSQEEMG